MVGNDSPICPWRFGGQRDQFQRSGELVNAVHEILYQMRMIP